MFISIVDPTITQLFVVHVFSYLMEVTTGLTPNDHRHGLAAIFTDLSVTHQMLLQL
jgi:hypothetical protein